MAVRVQDCTTKMGKKVCSQEDKEKLHEVLPVFKENHRYTTMSIFVPYRLQVVPLLLVLYSL